MTVFEIADRWGVHFNTVYKMVRAGTLDADHGKYKTSGIDVSIEAVENYEKLVGMPKDKVDSKYVMKELGCNRHMLMKYIEIGLLKAARIVASNKSPMYFSKKEVESVKKMLGRS